MWYIIDHYVSCVFQIDIVGHSGDSDEISFVNSNNPPLNDKERLQVLKVFGLHFS